MYRNKFHHIVSGQAQRGAALILIMFIIGLALTAFVIKGFNAASMKAQHDVKTASALAEAKEAFIAWAVSHPVTPGLMPYPDRREAVNPIYDGFSDCPGGATLSSHLIGQLPWRGADYNDCGDLLGGLGAEFKDGANQPLWYAVSKNIVHSYSPSGDPVINPGIINGNPWLRVLDASGTPISNRVAAVIIAPGPALNGQDRSQPAPSASAYLDSITIDGTTYSNHSYDDFVMTDTSSDTFNDRLIYITIDELIYALEKRVLMETKKALNTYFDANGHFPFAAGMGANNFNQCVKGNLRGLLPTNAPTSHACSCTAIDEVGGIPSTCDCHFSIASSVAFKWNADVFVGTGAEENAPFGNCSVSNLDPTICSCNGAGGCKSTSGETVFSCNACGICTSSVAGEYKFATSGKFETPSGTCALIDPDTRKTVACTNDAVGEFHLEKCMEIERLLDLPAWFHANQWQDYIFYELSANCSSSGANCTTTMPQLKVGEKAGVRALLASPGPEILTVPFALSKGGAQSVRPSCDIKDYLDSTENTNQVMANGAQDYVYQPAQRRTNSYNDQAVIVAP